MRKAPLRHLALTVWLVGLTACDGTNAPSVPARADFRPSTILEAVLVGDESAVREFLAQGVDVNAAETDGTTLLMRAIHGRHQAIADLLIAAGADVSASNRYGVTPLYLAARAADARAARALLAAGADANSALPDGITVLMTAAKAGDPAIVEVLLGENDSAEPVATSGYSAAGGEPGLQNRADPNARENWHAQTALIWAAAEGHADVVRVLLEGGADVNAATARGNTALHAATRRGWTRDHRVAGRARGDARGAKRERSDAARSRPGRARGAPSLQRGDGHVAETLGWRFVGLRHARLL